MVASRKRRVKALAPSLTRVASYRSACSVTQRFASPARDHESLITSHESRVQPRSTQTGTASWTHPLVSQWKHSPRVEAARNFIPGRPVPAGPIQPHFCSSITRTVFAQTYATGESRKFYFSPIKSLLTSACRRVQCKFVCKPSCRPGKYLLFDNQMNQARTRLVCP
jgi:hypothetical protein